MNFQPVQGLHYIHLKCLQMMFQNSPLLNSFVATTEYTTLLMPVYGILMEVLLQIKGFVRYS